MLTTRERLKGGGDALVTGARASGLPVFSMRSGTSASIIKALRSLAGIDPSPLSLRDASAAVRSAPLPSITNSSSFRLNSTSPMDAQCD